MDEWAVTQQSQDISEIKPEEPVSIKPLDITDAEISQFLQLYKQAASPLMMDSYCPLNSLVEKAQAGYEPYWLTYSSSKFTKETLSKKGLGSVQGFAVFHTDPTSLAKPRVFILHASILNESSDPGRLNSFLANLLEYIWTNINCEEIRVSLLHFRQNDGKLAPYDLLKSAYQENKFRWKTLVNDQQGNRAIVLAITRPSTSIVNNPRY